MPSATPMLLLALWIALVFDSLAWIARGWWATEGTVHLAVALVWVGLAARMQTDWRSRPRRSLATWSLAFAGPLAVITLGPGFRSLEAAAMIASGYGLFGLFTSRATWLRTLPLALLAVGVLPVAQHLDVLLGLPLRRWTAAVVAVPFGGLASSTVLEVEGGYAHVDLPCAGVQSLWSAGVVLAAATFAWGKRVGGRWLLVVAMTGALLLLGNVARVSILVGLHHVVGLPLFAEIVHTPLGLIVFGLALTPGLLVLRALPPPLERPVDEPSFPWPALALGAALWMVTAVVPAPTVVHRSSPVPQLPAGWTELATTDSERSFIGSRGGELRKASFRTGALTGSVAMISSRDWVNQHVPELCLTTAGWTVLHDVPGHVGSLPVRHARLERNGVKATALWWFQSADTVTDDVTERIADGLISDTPWVLVSVLLDGSPALDDAALLDTVRPLRAATSATLDALAVLETP